MASLAASIPPELFQNILTFVGDSRRLCPIEDPTPRREEMKHVSACASTCVYWAQLTRERMFEDIALRSYKDLCDLRSLLRAPPSGSRIKPIGEVLRRICVFHKLGDHSWFHHLGGLDTCGADNILHEITLIISGPVPPTFTASKSGRAILHPLFYSLPNLRALPPNHSHWSEVSLCICLRDIHFPNTSVLFNLLQDCLLLWPGEIFTADVTWDQGVGATTPLAELMLTPRGSAGSARGCTDDVLVAAMVQNTRPRMHRGPRLSAKESSRLLDAMRISSQKQLPDGRNLSKEFTTLVYNPLSRYQQYQCLGLSGRELCVTWKIAYEAPSFACIASKHPGEDTGIHYVIYIVIDLRICDDKSNCRNNLKSIDWDLFLDTIRGFPDLRGIALLGHWDRELDPSRCMVELVSRLRKAWKGVGGLLELNNSFLGSEGWEWSRIRLSEVLREINEVNTAPRPRLGQDEVESHPANSINSVESTSSST